MRRREEGREGLEREQGGTGIAIGHALRDAFEDAVGVRVEPAGETLEHRGQRTAMDGPRAENLGEAQATVEKARGTEAAEATGVTTKTWEQNDLA
jgi:hypothetical protein